MVSSGWHAARMMPRRNAMSEPSPVPGRVRGAGLSARAALIADQIRRAEDLLARFAQASSDQAFGEYVAWHDETERLLRFLLASDEQVERAALKRSPARGQAAELLDSLRKGMG